MPPSPVVSWAIQAHPARTLLAAALARRIGGPVDVVYDPDPENRIRSPLRTFLHLLAVTPAGATHRFQIQDDAVVCDGLRSAVLRAVAARPDRLLVFFVAGNPHMHAQAVRDACARDEPWAELSYAQWCPVVATCWPAGLARGLLAFVARQNWRPDFVSDDETVGRYVREVGHRPLASVPSLVEHPDVAPSLIGQKTAAGRDPGRVAACWIGNCGECVDLIDWTVGPGGS